MTMFFALMALWPLARGKPLRWWALCLAVLFALTAAARPAMLHGMNRVWMRFGVLLARVINPVIMALLFFLVLTPMAAMLRLRGKDPLRLRPQPDAPTYWIPRDPPGPEPATMADQF